MLGEANGAIGIGVAAAAGEGRLGMAGAAESRLWLLWLCLLEQSLLVLLGEQLLGVELLLQQLMLAERLLVLVWWLLLLLLLFFLNIHLHIQIVNNRS